MSEHDCLCNGALSKARSLATASHDVDDLKTSGVEQSLESLRVVESTEGITLYLKIKPICSTSTNVN